MYSELLEQYGVTNYIGGASYDFRVTNVGDGLKDQFERALDNMGVEPKEIYTGKQVHGAHVAYADGMNGQEFTVGKIFGDTDGLITNKKNIALAVKFADCTPIVLFDPIQQVLATLHSGWRGTVQQISKVAIKKMMVDYGSQVEDIVAYLGPSIDQGHYEVGPEVYQAFENFSRREEFFKTYGKNKYLLSMIKANQTILEGCGLLEKHIEVSKTSTWMSDQLHSSRQEGANYQLNALIAMMK